MIFDGCDHVVAHGGHVNLAGVARFLDDACPLSLASALVVAQVEPLTDGLLTAVHAAYSGQAFSGMLEQSDTPLDAAAQCVAIHLDDMNSIMTHLHPTLAKPLTRALVLALGAASSDAGVGHAARAAADVFDRQHSTATEAVRRHINCIGSGGKTLLQHAVERSDVGTVRWLLSLGGGARAARRERVFEAAIDQLARSPEPDLTILYLLARHCPAAAESMRTLKQHANTRLGKYDIPILSHVQRLLDPSGAVAEPAAASSSASGAVTPVEGVPVPAPMTAAPSVTITERQITITAPPATALDQTGCGPGASGATPDAGTLGACAVIATPWQAPYMPDACGGACAAGPGPGAPRVVAEPDDQCGDADRPSKRRRGPDTPVLACTCAAAAGGAVAAAAAAGYEAEKKRREEAEAALAAAEGREAVLRQQLQERQAREDEQILRSLLDAQERGEQGGSSLPMPEPRGADASPHDDPSPQLPQSELVSELFDAVFPGWEANYE